MFTSRVGLVWIMCLLMTLTLYTRTKQKIFKRGAAYSFIIPKVNTVSVFWRHFHLLTNYLMSILIGFTLNVKMTFTFQGE